MLAQGIGSSPNELNSSCLFSLVHLFVEEIHFCNYGDIFFSGGGIVTLKRNMEPHTIKIYVVKRLFYCNKI